MARPKKDSVDYFSHDCVSGKTIFILEQRYGNDGYAFWFKLLETLGTKAGHALDLNDISEMEFLQAKTRVSQQTTVEILNLLSNLDAIDKDLWQKNRVVWSQNFVDRVAEVYRNRRVEKPKKPVISTKNGSFYTPKPRETDQSTSKSTQSKVKYSKVKYSKENNSSKETAAAAMSELQQTAAAAMQDFGKELPKGFEISVESKEFADKYAGQTINNFKALIKTWIKNYKPDEKKKINPEVITVGGKDHTPKRNGQGIVYPTITGVEFDKSKERVKLLDDSWQELNDFQKNAAKHGNIKPESIYKIVK